jgi:CRP-like cAMP-binding protein
MQTLAASRPLSHPAPHGAPDRDDEIKLIGVAKSFTRDQEIYGEGEAADFVYKVVSGAVRSMRLLADGRRQITGFHLAGDVFGVEIGVDRRASAEALTDAVVIVARRATLTEIDQGARLWRHALAELDRSRDHVLTLGRRSAAERVASFLVEMAERTHAGGELTLPMSRQDMADFLGLTIETVSRTLTKLQADGLIEIRCCRVVRLRRPNALAELCE